MYKNGKLMTEAEAQRVLHLKLFGDTNRVMLVSRDVFPLIQWQRVTWLCRGD